MKYEGVNEFGQGREEKFFFSRCKEECWPKIVLKLTNDIPTTLFGQELYNILYMSVFVKNKPSKLIIKKHHMISKNHCLTKVVDNFKKM